MTPKRHVQPLIDLSDWHRLPKRHKPLAGQQSLFDFQTVMPVEQTSVADAAQSGDQLNLFESGRDLPGASERDQSIIWDLS